MAPTTTTTTPTKTVLNPVTTTKPPNPKVAVCFSFAAYAKTLIHHLIRSFNIPILDGLTDQEIVSIESAFHFTFPPDLRSILQVGLPVGHHFPNWRSSSPQQLRILLNLPVLNLSKNISRNSFWSESWGPKPQNNNDALSFVKPLLEKAPLLVPIYRNCYIPSTTPNLAGNPVFYVDGEDVKVLSFDVAGFFQRLNQFFPVNTFVRRENEGVKAPAWVATTPRRVQFWTDVAERGRRMVVRGDTGGWWCGGDGDGCSMDLRVCLDEVFWRLRDGGWREEEVKEMMIMMDGCDDGDGVSRVQLVGDDWEEDVTWHMKVLSLVLLRAGWSREDVVYCLDLDHLDDLVVEGKSCLEFHHQQPNSSSKEEDHQKCTIMQLRSDHSRCDFAVGWHQIGSYN